MSSVPQPFVAPVSILYRSHWLIVDAAWIAARVRHGLTPLDYGLIALAAWRSGYTPTELMRGALESERRS